MSGKSANDLVVPVPPGTLVYDDATSEFLGETFKRSIIEMFIIWR